MPGDASTRSAVPQIANFLIISSEICNPYKLLVFYDYMVIVCENEIIWGFCMGKVFCMGIPLTNLN